MKVKTPKFELDANDPFANDLLDRKGFSEKLTNIILANKDELVISLNGQWGEGKTTFIRMWKAYLETQDIPSIYIDAFKIDYTDDAFVPIALEIDTFVKDKLGSDSQKHKELYHKTLEVGKRLFLWTGKVGLKALTLNVIGDTEIDSLSKVADDIAGDMSEQFNKFTEEKLLSHQNTENLFVSYRCTLAEIAKIVGNGEKPLVIIIDELDRCRPKFAVQILEKIKHFFSVDNVVFVLSVNQEQLEHAIKAEYGIGIDANTYLQKFVDINASLPRISLDGSQSLRKYLNFLLKNHDINSKLEYTEYVKNFYNLLLNTLINNHASYRQIERIVLNIKILLSNNYLDYENLLLISYISCFSVLKPEIFEKLLRNKLTAKDLIESSELSFMSFTDGDGSIDLQNLKKYLKYCFYNFEDYKNDEEAKDFFNNTRRERRYNNNPLIGLIDMLKNFSYVN